MELVLNAAKEKVGNEAEKLDQEDQRIKVVELEILEEPTEESAAIICGNWMHRIRPILKNLSKRSNIYWTRLDKVTEEGYKKFLSSKSIDRNNFKFTKDEKLEKKITQR